MPVPPSLPPPALVPTKLQVYEFSESVICRTPNELAIRDSLLADGVARMAKKFRPPLPTMNCGMPRTGSAVPVAVCGPNR